MTPTEYVLNDLLDVVKALAVMVEELNPGRSEDHRMVKFLLERAGREMGHFGRT